MCGDNKYMRYPGGSIPTLYDYLEGRLILVQSSQTPYTLSSRGTCRNSGHVKVILLVARQPRISEITSCATRASAA